MLGLSSRLDFISAKLKEYSEVKERREKVLIFLKDLREKRNRMRKKLVKNCRKLLNNQKAKEMEKESRAKKQEHDMEELEKFNKEADQIIEESKKLEVGSPKPEDPPTRTLEVSTEKKPIGNLTGRNLYLSSSDSESSSSRRMTPEAGKRTVRSSNPRERKTRLSSKIHRRTFGQRRKQL